SGLPVVVPADPASWLTQGFPPPDPAGAAPATEIVLSLDGLARAGGGAPDDPAFGFGLGRAVALADTRIATFDGIIGLAAWFEGSAAATLPPIEEDIAELQPATTAPPVRRRDGGGSSATPWIVAGVVVVLVAAAGAVVVLVRRRRGD